MLERYQSHPYQKSVRTRVVETMTMKKRPAVCLADNLLYPGGGGQPCDTGTLTLSDGRSVRIARVVKFSGKPFAALADDVAVTAGAEVDVEIDWDRRYRFMRYHTASHVLMASLAKVLVRYAPKGIEIAEDGSSSTIRFEGEWAGDDSAARAQIDAANRVIAEGRDVSVQEFASLDEAVREFGPLFRGQVEIKGPVSIVVIDEWDANPCGGTHVANVREIGKMTLLEWASDRLIFSLTA
jgi:Ser-tRNA(Ala) deacylase AlaX